MKQEVPFFDFLHTVHSYVTPTAGEWLANRGGTEVARIAEEKFYASELLEVARYVLIRETFYWVLRDKNCVD